LYEKTNISIHHLPRLARVVSIITRRDKESESLTPFCYSKDMQPPTILCSTAADGSMRSPDHSYASVLPIRQAFLQKHGISPDDTTLVRLVYEGTDYTRFHTIDAGQKGDGVVRDTTLISDGLVVTEPGHALFLPLADCIGAIIHDPTKGILMLSHLGRHNLEQRGASKSVEYLVREHSVTPKDLTVWLSPAASGEFYPLYSFDNRGLHDVATEQFLTAGVERERIDISPIDSAANTNYYSHSQFLKGQRETDGRIAVVAMMN
jgi:hypothetical protein